MVRDFQSTPTVQQKPGTTGGADSVRTASCEQGGRYVLSPGRCRMAGGRGDGGRDEGRGKEKVGGDR